MSNIIDHLLSKSINEIQLTGTFSVMKRKKAVKVKERHVFLNKYDLTGICYEQFAEVNTLHKKYIDSITKQKDARKLIDNLYKIELTGACILVRNVECIVVEERKNCMIVVYKNNDVKVHLKHNLVFQMVVNNISYGFIGKNLKLNRFLKK